MKETTIQGKGLAALGISDQNYPTQQQLVPFSIKSVVSSFRLDASPFYVTPTSAFCPANQKIEEYQQIPILLLGECSPQPDLY